MNWKRIGLITAVIGFIGSIGPIITYTSFIATTEYISSEQLSYMTGIYVGRIIGAILISALLGFIVGFIIERILMRRSRRHTKK